MPKALKTATEPEAETAWENEIRARIGAIDEGCVIGVTHAEVMREADLLLPLICGGRKVARRCA